MHNFDFERPLLNKIHKKRGSMMNVSKRPHGRTIYPYTCYQALYIILIVNDPYYITQYAQKRVL